MEYSWVDGTRRMFCFDPIPFCMDQRHYWQPCESERHRVPVPREANAVAAPYTFSLHDAAQRVDKTIVYCSASMRTLHVVRALYGQEFSAMLPFAHSPQCSCLFMPSRFTDDRMRKAMQNWQPSINWWRASVRRLDFCFHYRYQRFAFRHVSSRFDHIESRERLPHQKIPAPLTISHPPTTHTRYTTHHTPHLHLFCKNTSSSFHGCMICLHFHQSAIVRTVSTTLAIRW